VGVRVHVGVTICVHERTYIWHTILESWSRYLLLSSSFFTWLVQHLCFRINFITQCCAVLDVVSQEAKAVKHFPLGIPLNRKFKTWHLFCCDTLLATKWDFKLFIPAISILLPKTPAPLDIPTVK